MCLVVSRGPDETRSSISEARHAHTQVATLFTRNVPHPLNQQSTTTAKEKYDDTPGKPSSPKQQATKPIHKLIESSLLLWSTGFPGTNRYDL